MVTLHPLLVLASSLKTAHKSSKEDRFSGYAVWFGHLRGRTATPDSTTDDGIAHLDISDTPHHDTCLVKYMQRIKGQIVFIKTGQIVFITIIT
ncbi:hypothetical protein TURU_095212 [Turdus rufiventris]|nr:hypothetical protein TURU_095212 [Turdus rufiventris]